jgi:hypothetical protein
VIPIADRIITSFSERPNSVCGRRANVHVQVISLRIFKPGKPHREGFSGTRLFHLNLHVVGLSIGPYDRRTQSVKKKRHSGFCICRGSKYGEWHPRRGPLVWWNCVCLLLSLAKICCMCASHSRLARTSGAQQSPFSQTLPGGRATNLPDIYPCRASPVLHSSDNDSALSRRICNATAAASHRSSDSTPPCLLIAATIYYALLSSESFTASNKYHPAA